jgi:hypothetical protein
LQGTLALMLVGLAAAAPDSGYGAPHAHYRPPSSGYGAPSSGYGAPPKPSYGAPHNEVTHVHHHYHHDQPSYKPSYKPTYHAPAPPPPSYHPPSYYPRAGHHSDRFVDPGGQCQRNHFIKQNVQVVQDLNVY